MANYKSQYTGEQIDEAVGKALNGGSGGGTQLYKHSFNAIMKDETMGDQSGILTLITTDDAVIPINEYLLEFLMTPYLSAYFQLEAYDLTSNIISIASSSETSGHYIETLTWVSSGSGSERKPEMGISLIEITGTDTVTPL